MAMKNVNLPEPLKNSIREFFKGTQDTKMRQDELDGFLKKLSPSLRTRVRTTMFVDTLGDKNKIIRQTMELIHDNQKSIALAQSCIIPSAAMSMIDDERNRRDKAFLTSILMSLDNCVKNPEEAVITQDDKMDIIHDDEFEQAIYFLKGSGSCRVKVRDHMGRVRLQPNKIENGDHFGEVSLIFDCPRSATVISEHYNIFARLEVKRYREIIAEYPEWEEFLKQNAIKSYRDQKIQFILRMFRRVEYLANFDDAVLFDLMFKLEAEKYEKGQTFLDPSHASDTLYFVENGVVEVFTRFESTTFVLEQLHKGSAINQRAIFMEDSMSVSVRCQTECRLLKLSYGNLENMIKS